jgi:hypothetical protein
MTTYLVDRPTYRAKIVLNPARWLGVEFVLLSHDRCADLRHWVDTDLYNISLEKYRWYAVEIETDIVLLLHGLAKGEVFAGRTSPRPSMIVPSSDGPLLIRRRFGATSELLSTETQLRDRRPAFASRIRSVVPGGRPRHETRRTLLRQQGEVKRCRRVEAEHPTAHGSRSIMIRFSDCIAVTTSCSEVAVTSTRTSVGSSGCAGSASSS